MQKRYTTLRLILGDQLNENHSWFESPSEEVLYVLLEMRQETDYVRHHIQKVVAFFQAMRLFGERLQQLGHEVLYISLDDGGNKHSLTEHLQQLIEQFAIQRFEYQLPDEYRLDEQLRLFCASLSIPSGSTETEHFMTSRTDLAQHFEGKKTFIMESFYRKMRRQFDVLMDGDQPVQGKWNFDHENRKKLPKDHQPTSPIFFRRDVSKIVEMLEHQGVYTVGKIDSQYFTWPLTREEGVQTLDYFVEELLPLFGKYQDAMSTTSWSVYHSRLSFCLNSKLLSPLEVVQTVEAKWRAHPDHADIAQVEGFIRQIIGWREYMRGIYWAKMPNYSTLNYFNHDRRLPDWFWTGNTKMNCLKHAIQQSLDYAYAHHIQRLMVTGNFALLAGIHPDEVDDWYLGIYIDAIEWVEITNTRGMSQFADGGIVGTKPYVSSANYIDKMSNYCGSCFYKKKEKLGDEACPFNSLYWHFYDRHREKLGKNPRIGMMYRLWDKQSKEQQLAILEQAEKNLKKVDEL